MTLAEGDVVRFDYVLRVDDDEKPLDTSLEEVAKEHGLHDPQKRYRPLTVSLGGRTILPALEAAVRKNAKVGASFKVDLDPKDAYGERDAAKIQNVPMVQFRKEKVEPKVGMILNFQGQRGVITRVAGGRIRLDMNHDLAGKKVHYDITVREVITDPAAKLQAVVDDMFPGGSAKTSIHDGTVELEVPDQAKFDQNWPMMKFQVLTQIRQAVGLEHAIRLVETYPAMPADPGAGVAGKDRSGDEE